MAGKGKLYRRTASGSEAVTRNDLAVPADYRRILALVETEMHGDAIRGSLRQFPDTLLAEWLGELEELGMLESRSAADVTQPLQFAVPGQAPGPIDEDAPRIEREASVAGASLSRTGAYLAEDRLKNRAPLAKQAAATVVLVVEDDPDQLALADLRVSMAGYQVRVAGNGQALKDSLRAMGLPDILLLDVMLPDADGFAILAGMRRHPRLALLPVILLTAKDSPADISRGLALGADGYVTKPYTKNILADTIRKVLKTGPAS
ncbi:MAG: response regulator [Betaproteobacteria bacterium]|nr:response regulator [Betaproteobacteria bacterium]MDH5220763.1 response regulator [Betaproteobacteria bacterium]MDH5352171.1 response regulator [Betaproteobacteria bacterium]